MEPQVKRKQKEFIDFNKLTAHEVSMLARKWENEARVFEGKVQRVPYEDTERLEKMWRTANALWRRVSILERWRLKNVKPRAVK